MGGCGEAGMRGPWYLGGEREEVAVGDVRIAFGLDAGTLHTEPATRDVRRGTRDVGSGTRDVRSGRSRACRQNQPAVVRPLPAAPAATGHAL